MGGGGHGAGTTYKGVTIHPPKRWHTVTGKGLCAIMWFWVLYRAKQDGPVVLWLDANGGRRGNGKASVAAVVELKQRSMRYF
ncbi:NADH dehydrogenase (ubiquinone) 1 beta subcomplex subunit 2 [Cucumis melo var. makuwa]|uniref:NADH dehydrogenase (Ubiquinone) 1 beta subcomplex subunit 2 n=1 Tax=Cucumis melo var. makuwa TaxID=1194695 RepID=A0A5A7VAL3_CUCMM|nr:NADH dehydrogenase (ubiquinone) 1 beta subcomplex subunit 2 [Cucumis melo var. makuwa]TYK19965.1 NADH dehydrogenase (ubiquinone) 1 beta subcomplex subunit 2 [Cucumis melo var. makuwa]